MAEIQTEHLVDTSVVCYYYPNLLSGNTIIVSVRTLIILTGVFHGLPQFLQANVRMITQTGPQLIPSSSFQIHYSLIIQSLIAVQSESFTITLSELVMRNQQTKKPQYYKLS
jgi:hypothetical protein